MMTPALTLQALLVLESAEVARRNQDLREMARRIYAVASQPLRFAWMPGRTAPEGGLLAELFWQGQPVRVALSRAWSQSLVSSVLPDLQALSPEVLDLLAITRAAPALPPGVVLRRLHLQSESLADDTLGFVGTWAGSDAVSNEATGHELGLWGGADFPVYAFFRAFDAWVLRHLPSPLAGCPMSLPLVGARWQAPAADLHDLAVGDILLIQ